jgi:chromosome segregation ATPase
MISSGIDEEDEIVDPRIEDKLEELNSWTDRINSYEKEFDEANAVFRSFLTDYSDKLKAFGRKIGTKSIQDARAYYEAKDKAATAQCRCQKTVVAYEKACQMLLQAKGEIELTERKFQSSQSANLKRRSSSPTRNQDFDVLWQEMLNQATTKLQEAEQLKRTSREEHEQSMKEFMVAEDELSRLERKLKNVIKKTQPYFDESFKFKQHLLKLKEEIEQLNRKIVTSKSFYATTLKDLEGISEEIHKRRSLKRLLPLDGIESNTEPETIKASSSSRRMSSLEYKDIVPELSLNSPRFHIEVKPTTLAVLSPQDLVDHAFSHSVGSTTSTNTSSCSVSHIDSVFEQSLTSASGLESPSSAEVAAMTLDKLHLSGFDEVNLD